jgi:NADH-quinone oxidoreductase subunit F
MTSSGIVLSDPETGETNIDGLYAGGDCSTGPWTVVGAIGSGRNAAKAIDRRLGGSWHLKADVPVDRRLIGEVNEDPTPRVVMPELPAYERAQCFSEVELGFTLDDAIREASRCFQCDVKE